MTLSEYGRRVIEVVQELLHRWSTYNVGMYLGITMFALVMALLVFFG